MKDWHNNNKMARSASDSKIRLLSTFNTNYSSQTLFDMSSCPLHIHQQLSRCSQSIHLTSMVNIGLVKHSRYGCKANPMVFINEVFGKGTLPSLHPTGVASRRRKTLFVMNETAAKRIQNTGLPFLPCSLYNFNGQAMRPSPLCNVISRWISRENQLVNASSSKGWIPNPDACQNQISWVHAVT